MKKIILSVINYFGYKVIKLHRKRKVTAYSKYQNLTYHPTPIGNYYVPKEIKHDIISEHMKRGMLYDENIINVAKEYIMPGTIVLDIGANLGQMSIEFSKYVGETGCVYSFEAQKNVFEILELNIKANKIKNIKTFYNAVFNISNEKVIFPTIDLTKFSSPGSFGIDLNSNNGIEVSTICIDALYYPQKISFMKIDIQGADIFALYGAMNTIKHHKMPIIFEYEEQFQEEFCTSFQDYIDFVEKINYKFVKTIDKINFLIIPK